ncbi:hypothetical protein BYT27DRAFT_7199796 [Phlegmacium glaucopus]|nr:hypothetical protein BYT27DRAFT_7199796 [Phlegmacium glaucopus]
MSDQPLPIHRLFDDPEADVVFQSVDGIRFRLQRKYIEVNTGAFPSAEFDTREEIAHLTETSTVLETLFQFVYPRRHPDLDDMEFDTVAAVAEAAEKYEVFYAMNICRIRMKQFLPSYASAILTYAIKHDYPKLIQAASSLLVRLPMSVVLQKLPSPFLEPWVRYHEAWDTVFEDALKKITEMTVAEPNTKGTGLFITYKQAHACHACLFTMFTIVNDLQRIQSLQELDVALTKPRPALNYCLSPLSCQYTTNMTKLCADILAKTKAIPLFSTFFSRK